jgi:O-antigen/teichoic acid export membrane protein
MSTAAIAPHERRKALGNLFWLLGDKALALLLGLVIFGLVARAYGPAGSGHFSYGAAMLQTGLGLSMVCAGVALLPRFCRMEGALAGAVANVFVLRLVASVLAMLAMMLFCVVFVAEPERRTVALVMLLAVPLIEPFYVIATYWLSRNHNRPTVLARSTGLLVRAAVVGIALVLGWPIWVLAAAWVLEAAVNASLQSWQARTAFAGKALGRLVRRRRMRSYLGFGLRFVLGLWLTQLFIRLDRLAMAEWMTPHDFGLYAAPMQLVEVWSQVSYLVGSGLASAYLYRRLNGPGRTQALLGTAAAMGGIGLCGLLAAWTLGPWLIRTVFGPAFEASAPFLLAGAAYAVLLFLDNVVDMALTAADQPWHLALKWGVAVGVALLVMWQGFPRLGAMAGPAGLATGLLSGWTALAVLTAAAAWRRPAAAPLAGAPGPA